MVIRVDTNVILDAFGFVRDAPDSLREELERDAKHVSLRAGTYYFHTGDPCKGVALLGKGSIRVFKTGENGREITLYHVFPGESCLLTLNSVMNGAPYPAEAFVEEDVEAALVPVPLFRSWVERDPSLRRFVFGVMSERLTKLMSLVDEITFGRLEQRLGDFLLDQFRKNQSRDLTLTMTHEHIASQLGSAREVISRLLKEFERRGILQLGRGRLTLQREELLRELVGRNG